MTRKARKKKPSSETVPEEIEAFIFSIFLELDYGAKSIEEAVVGGTRCGLLRATEVVKRYIRHVEAHEHDALSVDLVLKRAAGRCGYIVQGDARGFLLEVQNALKRSRKPDVRPRHHTPHKIKK